MGGELARKGASAFHRRDHWTSATREARVVQRIEPGALMANSVKIELEVGDVELEYEGPAEFARNDLLPLVRGLVEALSDAQFSGVFEEEWDEEVAEEAASGNSDAR